MTLTDSETPLVDALEFHLITNQETEVPCQNIKGCDNPAKWNCITTCCGVSNLLCDSCKIRLMVYVAERTKPSLVIWCKNCNTNYPYPYQTRIFRWIKL